MTTSGTVRVTTGAKVNLFLRVLGRRPDGFHELESIFHTLDLVDEMEMAPLPGGRIEVEMEPEPGATLNLPARDDNIVTRAALRLQEVAPYAPGASIRIRKRIPVGGGLGGGSSNAAGALLGLDRLWELDLDRSTLLELGATLGSDVPFCIDGHGMALVTGRGEGLARLVAPHDPLWFVLGISDEPLLTGEVYGALDAPSAGGPSVAPVTLALGQGDVAGLGQLLHNDLEAAAVKLRPRLKDDKEAVLQAGALGACVSGSGPTVLGLARDEPAARSIAEEVRDRFDRVRAASSASSCVTFL